MAKQAILTKKTAILTNGKLLTDQPLLDRGMNLEECRAILFSENTTHSNWNALHKLRWMAV